MKRLNVKYFLFTGLIALLIPINFKTPLSQKNINLAPISTFSKKISFLKKTASPKALFTITKDAPNNQNIAYDYSLMKMGDLQTIKKYAETMATYIKNYYSLKKTEDLHIVTMRGQVPNFASLLSQEIAKQLNINISYIDLNPDFKEKDPLNYALVTEKEQREKMLNGKFIITEEKKLKNKSIIFIDDSIVSGAVLKQACAELEKTEAKNIFPLILAEINGKGDHSFEDTVNRTAISTNKLDTIIKMLNNQNVIITSKLLNYSIQLNEKDFKKVLSRINLNAKISLYFYTFCYDNFRFKIPENKTVLSKAITDDMLFTNTSIPDISVSKKQSLKIQQLLQKNNYNISTNPSAIWREFINILFPLNPPYSLIQNKSSLKPMNIFYIAA